MGILYKKKECTGINAFSDADFAGDSETRKSTSGYVIKLGGNLISWGSRKQNSVALSTTESEFISACGAVQEVIWLDRLVKDICGKIVNKPRLFVDNQSAINLIKNPQYEKY